MDRTHPYASSVPPCSMISADHVTEVAMDLLLWRHRSPTRAALSVALPLERWSEATEEHTAIVLKSVAGAHRARDKARDN